VRHRYSADVASSLARPQVGPLAAGEAATATFTLTTRHLSHWCVMRHDWVCGSGDYTVAVGASSRDLRASAVLHLD
jgi:hypothetical protein